MTMPNDLMKARALSDEEVYLTILENCLEMGVETSKAQEMASRAVANRRAAPKPLF